VALGDAESWRLVEGFFRTRLEAGACVLFDGLEEIPDRPSRETSSRLIEALAQTYPESRLIVTSRPAAYTGEAQLPGFDHARIEPLEDEAIGVFRGGGAGPRRARTWQRPIVRSWPRRSRAGSRSGGSPATR
jgi:hypothetical protein